MWWARWKRRTLRSVCGPKIPGDRRRVAGAREEVLQDAHVVAAVALVERAVAEVLGRRRGGRRERRDERGEQMTERERRRAGAMTDDTGANPFSFGRLRG